MNKDKEKKECITKKSSKEKVALVRKSVGSIPTECTNDHKGKSKKAHWPILANLGRKKKKTKESKRKQKKTKERKKVDGELIVLLVENKESKERKKVDSELRVDIK